MSGLRLLWNRTINGLRQLFIDYLGIGNIVINGGDNSISNVSTLETDYLTVNENAFLVNTGTNTGLYIGGNTDTSTNILHLYGNGGQYYMDMNTSTINQLNFRRWNGTSWIGCGHIEFSATPHINFPTGGYFSLQGTDVLNYTTLGSTVLYSSLTQVGTLTSLSVSGNIDIDSTTLIVNSATNRVGIGMAPSYTLDITAPTNNFSIHTNTAPFFEGYAEQNNRTYLKFATNTTSPLVYNRFGLNGTTAEDISTYWQLNWRRVGAGSNTIDDGTKTPQWLGFHQTEGFKIGYANSTATTTTFSHDYITNPSIPLTTITGDISASGNVNIATSKTFKINNTNVLSSTALGTSVVGSSLTSVGTLTSLTVSGASNLNSGVATLTYVDNINTRSYLKIRTPQTNTFFRMCHFANTSTADSRINLNYNIDSGVATKDNSSLGAGELVFENDGNVKFNNANSITAITTTRCGVLPNGRFYVVSTTDGVNYFPIVSSSYINRVASGRYTGGAGNGTINFGVTYSVAPTVVGQIEVDSSTSIYNLQISSVTTTQFNFRKVFYNGTSIAAATAENFWWVAYGTI